MADKVTRSLGARKKAGPARVPALSRAVPPYRRYTGLRGSGFAMTTDPRQSQHLLEALLDARSVELELLDGLTDAEMLGARQHFVEPPIWEMGHVGWFQEYWLLRHLDGAETLLRG